MNDFHFPTIFGSPPPGPEAIEREGRRYVREWPRALVEPKVTYIERDGLRYVLDESGSDNEPGLLRYLDSRSTIFALHASSPTVIRSATQPVMSLCSERTPPSPADSAECRLHDFENTDCVPQTHPPNGRSHPRIVLE